MKIHENLERLLGIRAVRPLSSPFGAFPKPFEEIEKTLIGSGLGFDASPEEPGVSMYQRLKSKVHEQLKVGEIDAFHRFLKGFQWLS